MRAFLGPELTEALGPRAPGLAAVEGYWLEVMDAGPLVAAMGGLPNKVHGEQRLGALLDVAGRSHPALARGCVQTLGALGLDVAAVRELALLVDFNIMPLRRGSSLGVGSGYVFAGLARREGDALAFGDTDGARRLTQVLMRLWLAALYGRGLPQRIAALPHGCRRSWSWDDREWDVCLPTVSGGVLSVHGGGNTGTTSKAPYVARELVARAVSGGG